MTIIDAIKSGRPFRRPGWDRYATFVQETLLGHKLKMLPLRGQQGWESDAWQYPSNLLADDYELEPEPHKHQWLTEEWEKAKCRRCTGCGEFDYLSLQRSASSHTQNFVAFGTQPDMPQEWDMWIPADKTEPIHVHGEGRLCNRDIGPARKVRVREVIEP